MLGMGSSIQFKWLTGLLLAIVVTITTLVASSDPQMEDISRALNRIHRIPGIENWTVESKDHQILLSSQFPLSVSGAQALALETDENEESSTPDVPSFSTVPFHIQIHFLPFDSYSQLEDLQNQHSVIAEKLNKDAFDFGSLPLSDKEWQTTWDQLQTSPIPTHVAGESLVYFTTDLDKKELSFQPNEALKNCIWMRYRLGFLFSEIVR